MAVRTNILLKLSNFVDSLITFAKLQNIATNKILGRTTAGSGVIEELDIANYSNKLIPLTTTFADCENTTDIIDIVTVTIPANTLAVGDIIVIDTAINRLQNSGGGITCRGYIYNGVDNMSALGGATISTSPNIFRLFHKHKFFITDISSDVVTINFVEGSSVATAIADVNSINIGANTITNGATANINTNNTFNNTVGTTLKISAKWTTANANAYVRVETAQAYIIKKAV